MSEIVDEDDSLLAGEFVLGTLAADERARANELLGRDQRFAEVVTSWERRLGELHLMVEPVEPHPDIWQRITRRVHGVPPAVEAPPPPRGAEAPQRVEPAPRVDTPEAVPEPSPHEPPQPAQSPIESPKPSEPEQLPQAELAETGSAADPQPVDSQSELGTAPFAAVAAALKVAGARGAEPVAPEPVAPQPIPEPVLPNESNRPPKKIIVHDLRAERELRARDLKERKQAARRGGGAWRALGPLMTLIAASLAGLIVAWRYVPDRLPPQLQPAVLLNMVQTPATPPKRPRRLTSQFEE
jgi:hypothetical protein